MNQTKAFSCLSLAIILMALLVEGNFNKRPAHRKNDKKYPKPKFEMPNGPTNLLDQSAGHSRQIQDKVNKLNRMSPARVDKVAHDTYENGFSRADPNSNRNGLHSMKRDSAMSGHMTMDVQDTNHWKNDPGILEFFSLT